MTGQRLRADDELWRFEVPVDDRWHTFELGGDPLHVASRDARFVEFWARRPGPDGGLSRSFSVVGTGQRVAAREAVYRGTAIPLSASSLVWHLIERWPS